MKALGKGFRVPIVSNWGKSSVARKEGGEPGKAFFSESQAPLEEDIAGKGVFDIATFPVVGPREISPENAPESGDGNGQITPMDHPTGKGFASEGGQGARPKWGLHSAVVQIEIGIPGEESFHLPKVATIPEKCPGSTVSGNDGDATLKGEFDPCRIGQFGVVNGQTQFASGVGQQGNSVFRHAFPKGDESWIGTIDVLAIGQALHHGGTEVGTSIQLGDGIGPRGMDGDASQEPWMIPGQIENVIVRDIHRTEGVDRLTGLVVGVLVSQDHRAGQTGAIHILQKLVPIEFVQWPFQGFRWEAKFPDQQPGEESMPGKSDGQSCAGTRRSVSDNVDMAIDHVGLDSSAKGIDAESQITGMEEAATSLMLNASGVGIELLEGLPTSTFRELR